MSDKLIKSVEEYYTGKISKFGITPAGVDWNSEESQTLRFSILSEVIREQPFSIIDWGCGYGAYYEFLKKNINNSFTYYGYDISKEMIRNANKNHPENNNLFWIFDSSNLVACDYVVASGIFNVRLEYSIEEWEQYIMETLDYLNKFSKKGFSFNMLTSYSDKEFMKENLYYANPMTYFDYCKKNYSSRVSLRHDYPLYEFSIFVFK